MSANGKPRLGELDAMRALAAIAVMLFHYTVRFHEEYPDLPPTAFDLQRGGFGVNFFFAISGFVILMTLYNCKRSTDFVFSRVTRLLPTYWTSILLTFAVVAAFTLPGREVTWLQALGNVTMFQEFYHVPHVDKVYWSLQVEVLFYIWMFFIFYFKKLENIRLFLVPWLLLSIGAGAMDEVFHRPISFAITKVLMLEYISMFAVGIVAYRATLKGGLDRFDWVLWALALGGAATWGGRNALIGCALTIVVFWLFIHQHLRWLAWGPLVWIGGISFPLYLLHQNIGYVVMRETLTHGGNVHTGLILAGAVSVGLAAMVTYGVERPSMRYLRDARRRRAARLAVVRTP
ncbi:MAG: hypothetical protein RLZZ618_3082 [Pseudomonadota bacterium]|jgi:peptidoglycan/LPS O-acetylase OafA/YrhL